MVTYKISKSEDGKKLHRFLRGAMPGMPLSGLHKMLRVGRVKVNGKKGKPDTLLTEGDELSIYMPQEDFDQMKKSSKKFRGLDVEFDIIHEDEDILIVNKPAGLLTHPDQTEHKNTLINQVLGYLYGKGELDSALFTPSTVNRLDRNTSGLIVIGKNGHSLRRLNEEMRDHKIRKWYLTIVHGELSGEGDVHSSLERDHDRNETRSTQNGEGKEAHTHWRSIIVKSGLSLLEIELISGRTHQIRAHMREIEHPLIGDLKYGGRPVLGLNHQLLHAFRLRLPDGSDFLAPVPVKMAKILAATGFPSTFWRQSAMR